MKTLHRLAFTLACAYSGLGSATIQNPILFVTQIPIPSDYCTDNAVFCNHHSQIAVSGRGGDLWIRYPDGSLKNLTQAAGYGQAGMQGASAIQVRDPAVAWDGTKALFSMIVGAPTVQHNEPATRWQLYEISGLGQNETPAIAKVPKQPANYNNIAPAYGTDGRIVFTSDRPLGGSSLLYPQLDEYESAPTVSGLWSLDPVGGDLKMLDHAPSGDFTPFVDSFGRVVFTRWDHLQQDQQAEADRNNNSGFGTFNYTGELSAAALNTRAEVFPEPLAFDKPALLGTNLYGHNFNHFFPWQLNEDGSGIETLNHIGRHEIGGSYGSPVFTDDTSLGFTGAGGYPNPTIANFLQIKQDPTNPDNYVGVNAQEFGTHASGQIVRLTHGGPSHNADEMTVEYLTDKTTATATAEGATPPPGATGLYRDPLVASDGSLIASHTYETRLDKNIGSGNYPQSRYAYRLRLLTQQADGTWAAGSPLTPGIQKNISYYDPGALVNYSGNLWELQPVEVRARPKPATLASTLPAPEAQILQEENVDEAELRHYLKGQNLALAVMRNVTSREHKDRQQPYNLSVAGSNTRTVGNGGKIYNIAYFQAFQGDMLRGLGGTASPKPGRRVLALPMHDAAANPSTAGAPQGGVKIADDGSVAVLMPTQRAMTWQLTDANGNFVVRERNWVSFQAGEIRSCPACHGVNTTDQALRASPTNKPEALRQMVRYLKSVGAITATAPNPACLPALSYGGISLPSPAAGVAVGVGVASNCAWTAASNAPWITAGSAGGSGNGNVNLNIQANTGPARTGTLTIAGQTFTVNQAVGNSGNNGGTACSYSLSIVRKLMAASASSKSVLVTAPAGCAWTASSSAPTWLTVGAANGSGNATVSFSAAANSAATTRSANLAIGGQTVAVTQAGTANGGCIYAFGTDAVASYPDNTTAAHGGGSGSVPVTSPGGCGWTAASNVSWVKVTAGASATGNNTVQYSVDANYGGTRTGTMTIAGMVYTVTQN